MAIPTPKVVLSGLARKLVLEGLLPEADAQQAFQASLDQKIPFVSYLVQNKLGNARDIAQAASAEFGVPLLDIDALELDTEVIKMVKEDLVRRHHALPLFKRGNRLFIALSDPTNLAALDEIKFSVGCTAEAVLVEEDKLSRAIDRAMEAADTTLAELASVEYEDLDKLEVGGGEDLTSTQDAEIDDAPVVRYINKLLLDAIKREASDLHFEPYEKFYRIRLRIDGVLSEANRPPLQLSNKLAARIKVMARLNVSERRVPQDGRIKLKVSRHKSIDFRVSTCPTLYGEKVVLRILDSDPARLNIDQLGYEPFQKELFLKNLYKPYGMFLVTGPTGSGKTISLYSGINLLNKGETNISTVEDPVEINLPGVNQVQIDERTGMTFPKALKAFLRQDPNIILVGEIRDLETGSIAVKAAQTGHMVLSTLHTNDAPQTITRLMDMGIPPFAVATSLNIIVAQRLIRRLCPECRRPVDISPQILTREGFTEEDLAEGFTVYEAVGCDNCNRGYKGRTGIYQVMPISERMRRLIIEGANAVQLADQARAENIPDIRRSALVKVKQGISSLAEINSVTME